MPAATIKQRMDPSGFTEKVVLTASNGDTFASEKFSKVDGCVASVNDTSATAISPSISGKTITINATITSKDVSLVIWGRR